MKLLTINLFAKVNKFLEYLKPFNRENDEKTPINTSS